MRKLSYLPASFIISLLIAAVFATVSVGAPPTHLWSQRFGEGNDDGYPRIAVDSAGNVFMMALFHGTVNFGGNDLSSPSNHGVVLAKYDASGAHLWSRHINTPGEESAAGIATDPSGNVYIAGSFSDTIDLGAGQLTATQMDIFFAKYDANGVYQWGSRFGGNYDDGASALCVDSHGDIYVAGFFGSNFQIPELPPVPSGGSINLGSGILTSAGKSDMFLAKFNSTGAGVWSKRFGGIDDDFALHVRADGADKVVFSGGFRTTISFGGAPLNPANGSYVLAKYDLLGAHVWSRNVPGQLGDVAIDSHDNVIIGGRFNNTINLGGGNLVSQGGLDIFLAKFDPLGVHVWSKRFGGPEINEGAAVVAVYGADNILMSGPFFGALNVGGSTLLSAGATDIYLASYDAAGGHRWSRSIGGSYYDSAHDIATQGGQFVIAGMMTQTVDFGGGVLTAHGGDDIFLARYSDETVVPVRISSFAATPRNAAVELAWDLWSDEGLDRFALYRTDGAKGSPKLLHEGAIKSSRDSYLDANVEPGRTYTYELVITSLDGDLVRSQPATAATPKLATVLSQNTPNPFRSSTSIAYTLGETTDVVVAVYDAAGRVVVRLNDGRRDAGSYRIDWNGRDELGGTVRSGVYFYRLEGVRGITPQKMVLTR